MNKFTILPALFFLVTSPLVYYLKGKIGRFFAILITLIALINVALISPGTNGWSVKYLNLQITLLKADKLSLFVAYIFLIMGLLGMVYSFYCEDRRIRLLTFLYIGSSLGVVFSGDFISLYVFWELMALASTGLIWCNGRQDSIEAGTRYIIMHLIGGALLLAGILTHYGLTGSIAIEHMQFNLAGILIMLGVGLNCAFILLHTWLPDSYPKAPFWASVFLSVYTTKTAVYVLARTSSGWSFVAYMGAVMAVYGVTMALMQSNARKLLSYHIISQVGYMVTGIGLGGALGINGAIFHLWNHILYKSLLFMGVGAVIYRTGEEDLTKLGGLSRRMPLTTISVIIASLSIAGVPLFNGFVSKNMIFEAAHNNELIYLMLELASVGTFLSFFKFCYFGFIKSNDNIKASEAPVGMLIAMLTIAFLNILIGIYPLPVIKLLPFGFKDHIYTYETVFSKLQIMLVAGFLFIVGNRFFKPHKANIRDFDFLYIKSTKAFINVFTKITYLDTLIHKVYYVGKSLVLGIGKYSDNISIKIRSKKNSLQQKIANRLIGLDIGQSISFVPENSASIAEIKIRRTRVTPAGNAVLIVVAVFFIYLIAYIFWSILY